jgi:hypothetical protein
MEWLTFQKNYMPQSRKRPGHHEHRNPGAVSSKTRIKGKFVWAILFGVFGLLITMFATMDNYTVWVIGALAGAALGYIIGRNLEKEASH